jgi:hypothetical protein
MLKIAIEIPFSYSFANLRIISWGIVIIEVVSLGFIQLILKF